MNPICSCLRLTYRPSVCQQARHPHKRRIRVPMNQGVIQGAELLPQAEGTTTVKLRLKNIPSGSHLGKVHPRNQPCVTLPALEMMGTQPERARHTLKLTCNLLPMLNHAAHDVIVVPSGSTISTVCWHARSPGQWSAIYNPAGCVCHVPCRAP
jgi:hypothetical protein